MQELIVFVHVMVNFSHNRTKRNAGEKEAQERLIREEGSSRHDFLGAFDDSGNFAFRTEHDSIQLKADVLTVLSREYKVKGAVVVERNRTHRVLGDLTNYAATSIWRISESRITSFSRIVSLGDLVLYL